jgi:hypothetical protein
MYNSTSNGTPIKTYRSDGQMNDIKSRKERADGRE